MMMLDRHYEQVLAHVRLGQKPSRKRLYSAVDDETAVSDKMADAICYHGFVSLDLLRPDARQVDVRQAHYRLLIDVFDEQRLDVIVRKARNLVQLQYCSKRTLTSAFAGQRIDFWLEIGRSESDVGIFLSALFKCLHPDDQARVELLDAMHKRLEREGRFGILCELGRAGVLKVVCGGSSWMLYDVWHQARAGTAASLRSALLRLSVADRIVIKLSEERKVRADAGRTLPAVVNGMPVAMLPLLELQGDWVDRLALLIQWAGPASALGVYDKWGSTLLHVMVWRC